MATATTLTLSLSNGKYYTLALSDVSTQMGTYDDGTSAQVLSSGNVIIKDAIVGATGTTTEIQLVVNGQKMPVKIQKSANVGTIYNRQVMMAPIGIKGGSLVGFYQV